MAKDKQLVLAFFESEQAADEAVAALKVWDKATADIKLGNVGVIVRRGDGEIKQQKLGPRATGKGAGIGVVLGILAAPFTAGVSLAASAAGGAVGGGLVGLLFHKGLSKSAVERIGFELDAGHAAVGALVEPTDAARVSAKLAELAGTAEAHAVSGEGLAQAAEQMASADAPQPHA